MRTPAGSVRRAHKLALGRRMVAGVLVATVLAFMSAGVRGEHLLFASGAATDFTRGTMRVISITPAGVGEVTADGLRIGTVNGETRVAFVRPIFTSNVAGLSAYQVTTASLQFNPSSVGMLVPTTMWDSATSPGLLAAIFQKATRPLRGGDLTGTFQTLLSNGNNPNFGPGYILTSGQDFRAGSVLSPQFVVQLQIASFIRFNFFAPLGPIPSFSTTTIPNYLLSWTPSRTGLASLAFNGTLLLSEEPVQRLRAIPTIVPAQFIKTGNNSVIIDLFPDDAPVGSSPVTTATTFVVPTIIR